MELLQPESGLFVWTSFLFVAAILFLVAIIDILKSKFVGNNTKLIWVIVVLFLPLLGSVLYFIIGRKQKIKHNY